MPSWLLFAAGVVTLAALYAIITMALNLEAGVTGLLDLGIVSFLGIGAYTYVLLTVDGAEAAHGIGLGLPMWVGVLGAGLAGGLAALLIGLPTLRLRGEYFLIATFAFAEVLYQIVTNERWLTRGTLGFNQLPQPFRDAFSGLGYQVFYMVLILGVMLLVYAALRRITAAPLGRTLRAIRENETVALSVGKNVYRFKLLTFVLAGVLVGLTGPLYVWYTTLLVPALIQYNVTFTAWIALALGGMGNHLGALVGAFVLIGLQEALRFVNIGGGSGSLAGGIQTALEGLLLILIIRFRPQGILPEKPVALPASLRETPSGRLVEGEQHA